MDTTGLQQLVDLRTMSAVATNDGWLAVADSAEGVPTILTSPDGMNYEVLGPVQGLPALMVGPYLLRNLGNQLLLEGRVESEDNSALKTALVARSTDGQIWVDLELAVATGVLGPGAATGDGNRIVYQGVTAVPDNDDALRNVLFVITADDPDPIILELGSSTSGVVADANDLYAMVELGGGVAPVLARLDDGGVELLLETRRHGPVVTNSVGDTFLAFNDDRLFATTNATATWTEYEYPGSSRSLARFSSYGAVDSRLAPGSEPSVGMTVNGVAWAQVPAPVNAIDSHTVSASSAGVTLFFRLEKLEGSVLARIPWTAAIESAPDLDTLVEKPNLRSIDSLSRQLLGGLTDDVDALLPCIRSAEPLDIPDEIVRAGLRCDPALTAAVIDQISQSMSDNRNFYTSGPDDCIQNALLELSSESIGEDARVATDSQSLLQEINSRIHFVCSSKSVLPDEGTTAELIRNLVDGGVGPILWAPPLRVGDENHWQVGSSFFQLLLRSDPDNSDLVAAELRTDPFQESSSPFGPLEQRVFEITARAFLDETIFPFERVPGLISSGLFDTSTQRVCLSNADGTVITKFIPSSEAC